MPPAPADGLLTTMVPVGSRLRAVTSALLVIVGFGTRMAAAVRHAEDRKEECGSPGAGSAYTLVRDDTIVSATAPTTVLTACFNVSASTPCVFLADGRFFPDGAARATVALRVDGRPAGSAQTIAWDAANTTDAVQHSFSLVGVAGRLPSGIHRLQLVAWSENGEPFRIGAGSGAGVLVAPRGPAWVDQAVLTVDTARLEFDALPWDDKGTPYKMNLTSLLSLSVPPPAGRLDGPGGLDVISLASGTSFISPGPGRSPPLAQGDAMWVITGGGESVVYNNATLHSDNDICFCAEAGAAPMMTHAYFASARNGTPPARLLPFRRPATVASAPGVLSRPTMQPSLSAAQLSAVPSPPLSSPAGYAVTLAASAEPWTSAVHRPGFPPGVNPVQYQVAAGAGLVAITGLPIMGRAVLTDRVDFPLDYVCVGTTKGWPGCPTAGPAVQHVLANATVTVPVGHSGEVAFVAKSIVQADGADGGGTVTMGLRVDGLTVGSKGVQQLRPPSCVSTRTISTSYVSAGDGRLLPGRHLVEVVVTVTGDFAHLSMVKDLPLLWFG